MHQQQKAFENIMGKGEIARDVVSKSEYSNFRISRVNS